VPRPLFAGVRRTSALKKWVNSSFFVVDIFAVDMVKYSEILKGGIET
jgi:hypothetical protein